LLYRSNREGHYPALITCTEKRLQQLKPESKLLIKDKKATSLSDLPQNEYREIASELDVCFMGMRESEGGLRG